MLYIISIDNYTVKFHDNGANSQVYSKDLVARADAKGRIFITGKYKRENVLNSCEVSEVSLWDGSEYVVYPTAVEVASNFNLMMNNQALLPIITTTTTTEEVTTTTTTT